MNVADIPRQPKCECCATMIETMEGCADVGEGVPCSVKRCGCRAPVNDSDLCEDCYLWEK